MDEENGPTRRRGSVMVALMLATTAALAASPLAASAQVTDRVRVFLDCQTRGCPSQEFRTEIPFVDWVRERTAADLHVILTSQSSSGGTEYVFDLIGRGDFADETLRITAAVPATATQDERLGILTRTFQAALSGYVARRGYADQLEIRPREDRASDQPSLDPGQDPWRLWVFRASLDGNAEGEEQEEEFEVGARFTANRTTPDWKVNLSVGGDYREEEFELSDGTFTNQVDDWEADALVVRSLSPHWSAGTQIEINSSTSINREVGGRAAGAIEWNYFPYEEANRRQFLVHYQVGYAHVLYEDTTVFEKIEEDLFDHKLAVAWQSRQPWGDGSIVAQYSNYLHDWSLYRLSLRSDIRVRLLRGLEVFVDGRYALIRDQIYLPADELTDEEKLRRRRQLATGYEYDIRLGVSYRFGSIFNNVVNTRFPGLVRF